MVELAADQALEALDRVVEFHLHTRRTGEHLRHVERLRQEALHFPGAGHGQFVFFRQFVHAEDGDDVLQFLVLLQDGLHAAGDVIVVFADNHRVEDPRGRVERVHSRVDALFGDRARKHRGRVKVSERRGRRRVGKVVRRNVHGLHRGDRALVGRSDAFLQRAHVGGQCWLVAHGRRNTAEQSGHFRTGLREAEDVVDEEQHVLAFHIAEVFGLGKTRQSDAGAGARRLVHLAIDQRHAAFTFEVDHVRLDHLVIEVVAFAGPLANAGEHRVSAEQFRDVVHEFHDQNRLAHAGAAEQADLATLRVGAQKVDDLDARDEHFSFRRLINKVRCRRVDRASGLGFHRAPLVDRLTDHVHDAAEGRRANRNHDRLTGVGDRLTADQTFRRVHRDGADGVLAEVLSHFEHQAVAAIRRFQRVQDGRQFAVEHDVDNGADHLGYLPFGVRGFAHFSALLGRCSLLGSYSLKGFGTGDDLDQLLGNLCLAGPVVFQVQGLDQVLSVACRVVHRGHPACLFAGGAFQHRRQDLRIDVARQQRLEDRPLARLVAIDRSAEIYGRRAFRSFRRNQLLGRRHLRQHVLELGVYQRGDIEFARIISLGQYLADRDGGVGIVVAFDVAEIDVRREQRGVFACQLFAALLADGQQLHCLTFSLKCLDLLAGELHDIGIETTRKAAFCRHHDDEMHVILAGTAEQLRAAAR